MPALLRDSAIPSWKSVAQVLVAGLAFIAFPAGAEESDDEPPEQYLSPEWIALHLEEDQYEVGDSYRWHPAIYTVSTMTRIDFNPKHLTLASGQRGIYEVEISTSELDHSFADWTLELVDEEGSTRIVKGDKDHPELVYREILSESPKKFFMGIEAIDRDTNRRLEGFPPEDLQFTLYVKLRRVDYCTMWARVTGDMDYVTYGDAAYFNTFAQPTKVATGSISDPGMIDMIGDMVEGMAEMYSQSTDGTENEGSSGSALREDWENFVRKENEGGTENWGVSLVDAKGDADFTALETLLGGLTIEAAGPDSIETSFYQVGLTLSRLDVVPGLIDPNTGDRIKFIWREGQPGSASLVLGSISEYFLSGVIKGELYSEKKYDGRKLRITIEARFAALRGAMACQR